MHSLGKNLLQKCIPFDAFAGGMLTIMYTLCLTSEPNWAVYLYINTSIQVSTYLHIHAYRPTWIFTCIYIFMYIYIYTCSYDHVCSHVHVCMQMYVYIYIYVRRCHMPVAPMLIIFWHFLTLCVWLLQSLSGLTCPDQKAEGRKTNWCTSVATLLVYTQSRSVFHKVILHMYIYIYKKTKR